MKRVKLAFPFTQISGKLGSKQKLEYAENNNPAFDAPTGRQYARNYQPSLVICQRVSSGKSFFQIKTKAATLVNAGSKLKMALLGGTGAVRAAILTNATYRTAVERVYAAALAQGRTTAASIERYVYDVVYEALMAKSVMIQFFATDVPTQTFHNPWVYTNQAGGQSITIKDSILAKFWEQLATNPVIFKVDGLKGVAHGGQSNGDTFTDIINRPYNVLGLTVDAGAVKMGDNFVCFEQAGVKYGAEPTRVITANGAPDVVTFEYFLNNTHLDPWSD